MRFANFRPRTNFYPLRRSSHFLHSSEKYSNLKKEEGFSKVRVLLPPLYFVEGSFVVMELTLSNFSLAWKFWWSYFKVREDCCHESHNPKTLFGFNKPSQNAATFGKTRKLQHLLQKVASQLADLFLSDYSGKSFVHSGKSWLVKVLLLDANCRFNNTTQQSDCFSKAVPDYLEQTWMSRILGNPQSFPRKTSCNEFMQWEYC